MIRSLILIILVIVAMPVMAQDAFPAPFGLKWGASAADLRALGFAPFGEGAGANDLHTFTSSSAPKPWSKAHTYFAFLFRDRLVKVVVRSEPIADDVAGIRGKELYGSVKETLVAKYGAPSSHTEIIGMKLYKDYDEFYQCLGYSGCGIYVSIFKHGGGVVALALEGQSRGSGFLSVQYESPEFAEALADIKAGNQESDASAL
jgi:hypothetical protein